MNVLLYLLINVLFYMQKLAISPQDVDVAVLSEICSC